MFFNLTVPVIETAVHAQTRPVPSAPTGARPFKAPKVTAVRMVRALGTTIARMPRHDTHYPRAFGAFGAELTRLNYTPTERELEKSHWYTSLQEDVGGRWS